MKPVHVRDLKDQTAIPGPHRILFCAVCGGEFSANKSDYWVLPEDHLFTCCGEPLGLVTKQVTIIEI